MQEDAAPIILTLAFHNATLDERDTCRRMFERQTGRFVAVDPLTQADFRATRADADTVKIGFHATPAGRIMVMEGAAACDFRFAPLPGS